MSTDPGHDAEHGDVKQSPQKANPQASILPAAIAILLLAGLVYLPSIRGSKIWDDSELLSGKGLGNATSIPQCFRAPFLYHYYRPLTSVSFLLDHRVWDHGVWGSNTFGYHFTNVILHVAATALLIPVLLLAFRSRPIALGGALLFAVQPAQVSAVAWIGGRTDSLCTALIALFFLVLIAGARSTGGRRAWLLATSLVCYALAALAKEQALFLLPLVPMAIRVFGTAPPGSRADRKEMVFWTALFIPVALCLLIAWARFGDPLHPRWHILHQLPLIGPTIDYYTLLLITPTPALNHVMTLYSMQKLGVIGATAGCALGILALLLLVRLWRIQPEAAWFFAGALLLLAPVSNLYPMTTQTIAPYRAGTAGLCAAAFVGWAIVQLLERSRAASSSPARAALIALPIGIYAIWLCCLTCSDDASWKNSLTASIAVERYDPDSVFGTLETANAYLEFGSFEPAVMRLDKVSKVIESTQDDASPNGKAVSWDSRSNLADWAGALYGRAGLLKLDAGDRQSAIVALNKGKALSPRNEQVNAGLANYALAENDFADAEIPIRNVLAVQPELTGLRLRLGKMLVQQHRWKEADTELTLVMAQMPDNLQLCLLTAMTRIHYGNRTGAAQLLNAGLQHKVLQLDKLQEWLNAIGEQSLLKTRGIEDDVRNQ